MKTEDQSTANYHSTSSIYELDNPMTEPVNENATHDFIKNIFDEEYGFGESDCAGL